MASYLLSLIYGYYLMRIYVRVHVQPVQPTVRQVTSEVNVGIVLWIRCVPWGASSGRGQLERWGIAPDPLGNAGGYTLMRVFGAG